MCCFVIEFRCLFDIVVGEGTVVETPDRACLLLDVLLDLL